MSPTQDALQFKLQVPEGRTAAEDGQYFGVYAQAEFTYGGTQPHSQIGRPKTRFMMIPQF